MYQRFGEWGYSYRNLRRAKRLASAKCRSDLIRPGSAQQGTPEGPVGIITKFGAQWNDLNKILNEHWHILTCSTDLKDILLLNKQVI